MEMNILDDFEILKGNDVTFDEYTSWFEKYKNNNDIREINFQNEVVKPFLRGVCNDLDVEVCDKKGPDTKKHDYLQYCGTYIDERSGKEKTVTPDLIIAKNWNWLNKENEVDYRAIVEVKSPYQNPIFHKNYNDYSDALKKSLERHLSARKNDKVILTDTMKWEFYKKSDGLKPIQVFRLYELRGSKWEWKKGTECILKDNVTKVLFGNSHEYKLPMKDFEDLKKFLIEFLKKED